MSSSNSHPAGCRGINRKPSTADWTLGFFLVHMFSKYRSIHNWYPPLTSGIFGMKGWRLKRSTWLYQKLTRLHKPELWFGVFFSEKAIKNRLIFLHAQVMNQFEEVMAVIFMSRGWCNDTVSWIHKKCATNTRTFIKGFSENRGTPKSSIFIGFSIRNHPFWGIPIFGNTHMHGMLCYPCSIRTPMETALEVWFLHHPVGSLRITAWAPWGLRLARQRWEGYEGRFWWFSSSWMVDHHQYC